MKRVFTQATKANRSFNKSKTGYLNERERKNLNTLLHNPLKQDKRFTKPKKKRKRTKRTHLLKKK